MKTLIVFALSAASLFAQGALSPVPIQQPLDNAGKTLIGGCLYTYQTGGTTPLATYSNQGLTVANTNPIVLNSSGRAPAIFISPVSYKFVLGQRSVFNVCPATPGTVVWSQDPVFDSGQQATSALNTFIALLAASGGSSHIGFIQPQTGAVAETLQAKLRQALDVKDFGAACDGTTDDTAHVQAALTALNGSLELRFSGKCAISSGVYIPASAQGALIYGSSGAFSATKYSGLVAKSGSAPFQMLQVYAQQITMRDIEIDCAATATSGLVVASSQESYFENVGSRDCTSDAMQIAPANTPTTTLTSNLAAGAGLKTFTVANAALAFPLSQCANTQVYLSYGTGTQETAPLNSVVGNTITVTATTSSAHAIGQTIQCAGNNDNQRYMNIHGTASTGWGMNMFMGADQNNITIFEPQFTNDIAGGLLMAGNGIHVYGGHFEQNTGPAYQAGDAVGGVNGRQTGGMTVTPPGDIEGNGLNALKVVCSGSGYVQFVDPSTYGVQALASLCPTFSGGTNDLAFGRATNAGGGSVLQVAVQGNTASTNGRAIANIDPTVFYQNSVNVATECTALNTPIPGCAGASANDAIVAQINDASGNPLTVTNGKTRVIISLAHDCGTGCTVSVNGSTSGLGSHFKYTDGPAWVRCTTVPACTALKYTGGQAILDVMRLGNWVDMSQ